MTAVQMTAVQERVAAVQKNVPLVKRQKTLDSSREARTPKARRIIQKKMQKKKAKRRQQLKLRVESLSRPSRVHKKRLLTGPKPP